MHAVIIQGIFQLVIWPFANDFGRIMAFAALCKNRRHITLFTPLTTSSFQTGLLVLISTTQNTGNCQS